MKSYCSFLPVVTLLAVLSIEWASADTPAQAGWNDFVSNLEADDRSVLGDSIRFPLESNLATIPGWESITTEGGFLARVEELLPDRALIFLNQLKVEEIFQEANKVVIDSEPRWQVSWFDEASDSSLTYAFVITREGGVRLVSVDGAG